MAARMAILKAARQLAIEANVHVHIRKFNVINQECLNELNTRVIASILSSWCAHYFAGWSCGH